LPTFNIIYYFISHRLLFVSQTMICYHNTNYRNSFIYIHTLHTLHIYKENVYNIIQNISIIFWHYIYIYIYIYSAESVLVFRTIKIVFYFVLSMKYTYYLTTDWFYFLSIYSYLVNWIRKVDFGFILRIDDCVRYTMWNRFLSPARNKFNSFSPAPNAFEICGTYAKRCTQNFESGRLKIQNR